MRDPGSCDCLQLAKIIGDTLTIVNPGNVGSLNESLNSKR